MTTDENILEEMLERSTNPKKDEVDNMAVQMFCMIVSSNKGSELIVKKAHELIVKKIRSQSIIEANRAIGILEECMSKGGEEFQKKTAKFSFLNELIALVLDRHTGSPVPVETKKRIMECLMLWTAEHSDKTKIQEAYDNLKKQVNFDHGPPSSINTANGSAVREQRSSILGGKDDMLVAKLLKQGGEENYKKANLVIQHRFNQEARRTEFICHLKSELKKIESTMEVLEEMLNSYCTDTPGQDTQELMQELFNTCKGHNEQMARWPDFLGESEPDFLVDILTTKDLLMGILQRYKEVFESNSIAETLPKVSPNSNITLTNITTSTATGNTSNTDILSELLGDALNTTPSSSPKINQQQQRQQNIKDNGHTTLDELTEIFGSIETKSDQIKYPSDLLGNFDLLEPINVFGNESKPPTTTEKTATNGEEENQKPQGFKELREIDKLSEEIFKQSLQSEQRQTTFKKEPEKITLNDLAKDKMQTSLKSTSSEKKQSIENLTNDKMTISEDSVHLEDQFMMDDSKDIVLEATNIITTEIAPANSADVQQTEDIIAHTEKDPKQCVKPKPLAEIKIDLDELTPVVEGQRILLDDEDIQVSLNFTADRPTLHVSVIVMSVSNKSRLPVEDFHFEASVRKPCKVRLLPPSDTRMAPRKPFRPSEPINQVILLMNPTENPVDITCIVGYKLGDDPDPIKESIVAKDIPYV